jgi:NitT/TauT family transport system ATP-binding protein
LQLCSESQFTVVFVTHSIPEALRIGTRILLLSAQPGRVKAELENLGLDAARVHDILFDGNMQEGAAHV